MKKQLRSWAVLVGLAALGPLAPSGCTPPESEWDELEWAVANHTADTLWVTARYPLDSLRLTDEAQIDGLRAQLVRDSLRGDPSGSNHGGPLTRLTRHRGAWYWVRSPEGMVNAALDYHAQGARPWARLENRATGTLTYPMPPRKTQVLTRTFSSRADPPWWQPTPAPAVRPIVGLWLRQGAARRRLLPGPPLSALFRAERTGREHAHSARARVTLPVGPGLVPVLSPWERLKRALVK